VIGSAFGSRGRAPSVPVLNVPVDKCFNFRASVSSLCFCIATAVNMQDAALAVVTLLLSSIAMQVVRGSLLISVRAIGPEVRWYRAGRGR
jgi:hypothetical protein